MTKRLFFIDFETYWDSKAKYSLEKTSIVEYVRDPRFKVFGAGIKFNGESFWLSGAEMGLWCERIAHEVGWSNIALVGHNIKFDGFILREKFECVPGQYIDTKGMSRAVHGKSIKNHSLQTLAEHYNLQPKGIMKTDGLQTLSPEQEAELAAYCLHDVELCSEIYSQLAKEFPQSQYAVLDRTIRMFVLPQLTLDVSLLEQASKEEGERREKIFETIGLPREVFASNVKFPNLLRERGFDVPTKPSPRQTDECGNPLAIPALALGDPAFLELLESENEELKCICEARVAAKSTLLQTRTAKLAALGRTGPWSFDVEFSGADQTHRFSGGSGAGGNPQNFTNPRKILDLEARRRAAALRLAVKAPEGCSLIVGDFANIEFRIVAYLAQDPGLIYNIENKIDPYCEFASVFFERHITKNDERERAFGKAAILGLGYNMGWEKFIKTVRIQTGQKIDEPTARRAVDLYRKKYSKVPGIWEFLGDRIVDLTKGEVVSSRLGSLPIWVNFRRLILPSGLAMRYPNLRQEPGKKLQLEWVYDVYRQGRLEKARLYGGKVLENISQGLAGEICKEAMLKFGDAVTGLVHDEIHLIAPDEQKEIAAHALKQAMSAAPKWFSQLKLDAEVGTGKTWGSAK